MKRHLRKSPDVQYVATGTSEAQREKVIWWISHSITLKPGDGQRARKGEGQKQREMALE